MKTLLVVYHSMTGGTRQMAEAAAAGAAQEGEGVSVRLLRAPAAGPDDVLDADGYLFATPENLAAISGLMKDFFDRSYYAALDRINGRPYALPRLRRQRRPQRGAAGRAHRHRLAPEGRGAGDHRVHACADAGADPAPEDDRPDDLERCAELGQALAAGLALGIF